MKRVGGKYQAPEPLNGILDPGEGAFVPALSPDGRCLVFNTVGADLKNIFIKASFRLADGPWSKGQKIGGGVNTSNPRFPGFSRACHFPRV
jgi:hypothetical protein